jgi:serine/threonine protein kinase
MTFISSSFGPGPITLLFGRFAFHVPVKLTFMAGNCFILVMEYVKGESLAERLAGRALEEKGVGTLDVQIAEALEEEHEQNIVHRDLKPGNIVVTPKGRVKILDFGLAQLLQPASDKDLTRSAAETRCAAGTVPYMSPEQIRGDVVDGRSDLFSFGATLYEMAIGRRAFDEKNSSRLIDAILNQPPVPPRAVDARISPELDTKSDRSASLALSMIPGWTQFVPTRVFKQSCAASTFPLINCYEWDGWLVRDCCASDTRAYGDPDPG